MTGGSEGSRSGVRHRGRLKHLFTIPLFSRLTSLRSRLLLLLAFAMAPAAFVSVAQGISEYQRTRDLLQQSVVQATKLAAEEQNQILESARQVLSALARQEAVQTQAQPACDRALLNAYLGVAHYYNIAVVGKDGHFRCSVQPVESAATMANHRWFKSIMSGADFVVSDPEANAVSGGPILIAAVPLTRSPGSVDGALTIAIDTVLFDRLARPMYTPKFDFVGLVDEEGQPFELTQTVQSPMSALPPKESLHRFVVSGVDAFETPGSDGKERIYALAPIIRGQLYLLVGEESSEVFGIAIGDFLIKLLLLPGLIWTGAIFAAWLGLEQSVIRWISYLQRIARAYAAGRYSIRPVRMNSAASEFQELGTTFTDMAEAIEQRTHELQDALKEKELLVREVHHRVKNNLQVVTSLFNLQLNGISDDHVRAVFLEAQRRLNALALVHRSLYEAESLRFVDVRLFLEDLCAQLAQASVNDRIEVSIEASAPSVMISSDTAVPLALLITEAVTNSYKHAFPGRERGRISIGLTANVDGTHTLTIEDDGIARPEVLERTPKPGRGLGGSLIRAFARQLGGEVTMRAANGMQVIVTLPSLASAPEPAPDRTKTKTTQLPKQGDLDTEEESRDRRVTPPASLS